MMPPMGGGAATVEPRRCDHPLVGDDDLCAVCGACPHEVVLNGACFTCGATGVVLDNKREAAPPIVPAARLARR